MNKLSKTMFDELVKLGLEVKRKELLELELLLNPVPPIPSPIGKSKIHWTQRPGAKAKMSRAMKKGWRTRKS